MDHHREFFDAVGDLPEAVDAEGLAWAKKVLAARADERWTFTASHPMKIPEVTH